MEEIVYKGNRQKANLAGRSVAEVRDVYGSELGISGRAQASLNGKRINTKSESSQRLGDGDELQFKAKSRKSLVLVAAFLITFLATGGFFAYTSLITSASIAVAPATSDYASITADADPPAGYTLVGSRVGSIDSGKLFDVTRSDDFTGDLEVQVYLTNIDELVKDYSFWMVRVEVQDALGNKVDADNATLILSLQNPTASFAVKSWTATRYVVVTGGSYRALPFSMGITGNDPLILCQVVQVGN